MLLIIIISDIITIRADIDSISFYSFNSESSNKRSTKLFEIQEKVLYTYQTHSVWSGSRQRWRMQRRLDGTRLLERRRASFTGFFSVSSFSWWPRVGDLQTVPNPRWQRKFKVRGVVGGAGGSGDLFGKKERENGARSKDGFYSSIANELLFPISFLHFSLVFLSWLSKDFPMISPNALFHPPSLSGMEFLFSTSFEKFSPYYSKIFFFSFLLKSINRFHKVIVIFF